MSNKMHKEDLIQFICSKSQECLLRADEPEQRDSYVFWNIMELLCKKDGKVMMLEVGVMMFSCLSSFRKMASKLGVAYKKDVWCLPLATPLCAAMPEDENRKAVLELGDNFASKGLTFASHICYVVANKESGFDLIGCESLPVEASAMKEAIERTEVYKYVLSLTSGFALPNFQEFKLLIATILFESGFSAQALEYCENISRAVTTLPDRITDTLLDQLICLSTKVCKDKEEENPEWLLNLSQLHKGAAASDSCTGKEQHNETPPTAEVSSTLEDYSRRALEHRAFSLLTEEVISKYTIGALLGYKGGAAVFDGVCKADGREVAIKIFIRDKFKGMMTVSIDVGMMEMVSKPVGSPFALDLLEWFEIPDFIVLILERPIPCMELLDFCEHNGGKLPEPLVRDIMLQLVQAARHCRDCRVFHNSIKLGNILINTNTHQIKFIDFGVRELLQDPPYTYFPVPPEFLPPEWHRRKNYSTRPTTIWVLGIVLFKLVYGELPFVCNENISSNQLHFGPGVSKDCCDLISLCLKKYPNERANFREILKHRWFKTGQRRPVERIPVIGHLLQSLLDYMSVQK